MITTLSLTVLLVLLIIYIVRIYQTQRNESFVDDVQINLVVESINSDLTDELKQWDNIGLPFYLADDGNYCPNWDLPNSGSTCQQLDTNYVCTLVNSTPTGRNTTRSYCNNWLDDSIMNYQRIPTTDIITANLAANKDSIIQQLTEFNKNSSQATDILNTIKNNSQLSNLQQYFLDNNSANLYNKQYLIDENNKNIDIYNNDITSAYYKYRDNQNKRAKYEKYDTPIYWTLYILIAIVIIAIILNILFSRVSSV